MGEVVYFIVRGFFRINFVGLVIYRIKGESNKRLFYLLIWKSKERREDFNIIYFYNFVSKKNYLKYFIMFVWFRSLLICKYYEYFIGLLVF